MRHYCITNSSYKMCFKMINMSQVTIIIYSLCKNITNIPWTYFIFHFEHFSCKRLNISMVYRDSTILYWKLFVRWLFVIVNKSKATFSRDMYSVVLARALNVLFTFLRRPLTWVSKLNLLSILTPNSFSKVLFFIRDFATQISIG